MSHGRKDQDEVTRVGEKEQGNPSEESTQTGEKQNEDTDTAVTNASVMDEIKKGNKLLRSIVKSIKEHERRLKAVETDVKNTASIGSTPKRSRTR